jgi:ribonuclease-3 family protein
MAEIDLRKYSPLTFAFLGDGVYGLYVRSTLVKHGNAHARKLHEETSRIVSARAQAVVFDQFMDGDILSDEEKDIMRRGSNAHVTHQAKNASSQDYHKATGLEALFGYLYLLERTDRISELAELGIRSADK